MIKLRLKNNKGFALILSYLLVVTLFIMGAAFFSRTLTEKKATFQDRDNEAAFNIAEAGIMKAIVYMRNRSDSDTVTNQPFDPFNNEALYSDAADIITLVGSASAQDICAEKVLADCPSNELVGGTYQVLIDPANTNVSGSPTDHEFKIVSKGTSNGVSRIISVVFRRDNFARFAYFSDTEHYRLPGSGNSSRIPVWFISTDEITGPTHTNGHYHIAGDPVFHDSVASGDDFITYYDGGPPEDNPVFEEGISLGVNLIPMPHQAIELHNEAVKAGYVFNGDTSISLNADGTLSVSNNQLTQDEGCDPCVKPAPANSALYVSGGDLSLSGTLSGSLTVGCNRNIIITGHIRYNIDPRVETSHDMLGIIAERRVIVSSSAPNDLFIDASIMAMDRSFEVENWASGSPRGTLTVFGGIIQSERGPVGTFNSATNSVLTGFSKNYIYDERFETNPPLYFPMTGDYLQLVWIDETP